MGSKSRQQTVVQTTQAVHRLLARRAAPETAAGRLRVLRAIVLLKRIGSPEAHKVLEALAAGAPAANSPKKPGPPWWGWRRVDRASV